MWRPGSFLIEAAVEVEDALMVNGENGNLILGLEKGGAAAGRCTLLSVHPDTGLVGG
jgi:hypothetical protein